MVIEREINSWNRGQTYLSLHHTRYFFLYLHEESMSIVHWIPQLEGENSISAQFLEPVIEKKGNLMLEEYWKNPRNINKGKVEGADFSSLAYVVA